MINCKICNKEFEPNSPAQKICSDECRYEAKEISKAKWRKIQKSKWASYTRNWRESNPERSRVTAFRTKANKLGLPFDLTEDFFVVPEICPVLGIPMDSRDREHAWSVDRLVPENGYTRENCRIISIRANRLKNNASSEELRKILSYIENSC